MADAFALQSHQNIIVLGRMDIRDAKMSVSLHLILLDQRKFGHVLLTTLTTRICGIGRVDGLETVERRC